MRIALLLHLWGVVVWIGGMFFAYMALRPAAAELLAPEQRLPLWAATFRRFFVWVWISVVAILVSGFAMIGMLSGIGAVPRYVYLMMALGSVMMVIFVWIFTSPYPRLCQAVELQEWKTAGQALARIRVLVGINLGLGMPTIAVALLGPILG